MRTERENFERDVDVLMRRYNKWFRLITRNLKLARQLRDSWKEYGLLKKAGHATYHVDRYYGKGTAHAKKAGWVVYVGEPKCVGLKPIVILSTYTGFGGQRLYVWETNK